MGLAQDLMRGVSGRPDEVALFANIAGDMERDQAGWIAALRAAAVKAAHPDDGWVDRECNTVFLCYPQFDDGVKVGDLIALGWPQWSSKKPQHRIVRVIDKTVGRFQQRWVFEPANDLTAWDGSRGGIVLARALGPKCKSLINRCDLWRVWLLARSAGRSGMGGMAEGASAKPH